MKKLNKEDSEKLAEKIRIIVAAIREMDVEYLKLAMDEMKDKNSFRQSAMVLNPSPFTAIEQGKLDDAKLHTMELIHELAINQEDVFNLTMELHLAKSNSEKMKDIFGV